MLLREIMKNERALQALKRAGITTVEHLQGYMKADKTPQTQLLRVPGIGIVTMQAVMVVVQRHQAETKAKEAAPIMCRLVGDPVWQLRGWTRITYQFDVIGVDDKSPRSILVELDIQGAIDLLAVIGRPLVTIRNQLGQVLSGAREAFMEWTGEDDNA